jgi:hypothetical protein
MIEPIPIGTVISSRELTFTRSGETEEAVIVTIGAPIQAGDDYWVCPYQIKAQSFQKQFRMAGVDSMQALIHTVGIIAVELETLALKHKGTFQYFDDPDLGFPAYYGEQSK